MAPRLAEQSRRICFPSFPRHIAAASAGCAGVGDVEGERGAAAALGTKEKQVSRRSAHTHTHAHECLAVCVALCNLIMGPAWTASCTAAATRAAAGGKLPKIVRISCCLKVPQYTHIHVHVCLCFFLPFLPLLPLRIVLLLLLLAFCSPYFDSSCAHFRFDYRTQYFFRFRRFLRVFFSFSSIAITSCRPIIDDCAMSCHNLRSFHFSPSLSTSAPAYAPAWLVI